MCVALLILGLVYGRNTVIWREKGRCMIRAVTMDNLRSSLGIRRRDRIPNSGVNMCSGKNWWRYLSRRSS